jgi:hypothetical protein
MDKFHFLKSRKFWTAVSALAILLITCFQTEPFPTETFVNGVVAIALGYIGGVAFEDGMAKKSVNWNSLEVKDPGQVVVTGPTSIVQEEEK